MVGSKEREFLAKARHPILGQSEAPKQRVPDNGDWYFI